MDKNLISLSNEVLIISRRYNQKGHVSLQAAFQQILFSDNMGALPTYLNKKDQQN